jgi:hypothetical protein
MGTGAQIKEQLWQGIDNSGPIRADQCYLWQKIGVWFLAVSSDSIASAVSHYVAP